MQAPITVFEVDFDESNFYISKRVQAVVHKKSRFRTIGYDNAIEAPGLIAIVGEHVLCVRFEDNHPTERTAVILIKETWKIDMKVHKCEDQTTEVYITTNGSQEASSQVQQLKLGLKQLNIEPIVFENQTGMVCDFETLEVGPAKWREVEKYPPFADQKKIYQLSRE